MKMISPEDRKKFRTEYVEIMYDNNNDAMDLLDKLIKLINKYFPLEDKPES
jgi:hypothetical protein